MNWHVLKSIFKRDFVSYFSSPTGYVFICVFVVLSALATFWPPEFFSNNLANLDQLSQWLPFIMLVFIPAITMSIWAEERRQGTDELLLTIPASDFDVVLGKYLAAVAIFTVSLLFSAFSIFLVFLYGLGSPDFGLFVSTYVGYWFIGMSMISIGMVASFVTSNLTVGFILGMLLNLPLALFGVADWIIKDPNLAQSIRRWSALEQFHDFQRGVLSLGGMVYFVMIAVVMLYLSMILIGQRHWQAREQGRALTPHFIIRTLSLGALAVGLTAYAHSHNGLRIDISTEQLSSLSPDTLKLLTELRENEKANTIKIDAYVSRQVPTEYTETQLNLVSALQEIQALGGGKIQVELHKIDSYGPEAVLAEKTYGITPQQIVVTKGNAQSRDELFLAAAITSGLDKIIIPFFGKGIPVEYELIRSIITVSEPNRLKLGVINTGIPLVDSTGSHQRDWPLISELRKQYDVSEVSPAQPIEDHYDVLLAVQPSMLEQQPMDHLVDAIRSGTHTVILEDPYPHFYPPQYAVGTAEPKQQDPRMSMFGGGQPPPPKGDISQLWRLLGVRTYPTEVVWQEYMPDRSVGSIADPQWVFIDHGNGAIQPFNPENPISSGLNQLLLLYPGSLAPVDDSPLTFEQLAVTGEASGTVEISALSRRAPNIHVYGRRLTHEPYVLAAQIHGTLPAEDLLDLKESSMEDTSLGDTSLGDKGGEPTDDKSQKNADTADKEDPADRVDANQGAGPEINVALITDIDWIIPDFFAIRQSGDNQFLTATQNVTFILNTIDVLAGEDRFVEIRKRTRMHRTLTKIDEATLEHRDKALEQENEFVADIKQEIDDAQQAFEKKVADVQKREGLSANARQQLLQRVQLREQDKLTAQIQALEAERSRKVKQIQYQLEQEVRSEQDQSKLYAILVPPILPLLLALYVFFGRRKTEREGVAQDRLR
jgi:ABC-2 type transport system permease protein